MALWLRNNTLFLHVPKTGGNYVTKVLEKLQLIHNRTPRKHLSYERTLFGDYWKKRHGIDKLKVPIIDGFASRSQRVTADTYVFCFIRHPLRWAESFWLYQKRKGWPKWISQQNDDGWHPWMELDSVPEIAKNDFDEFLRWISSEHPAFVSRMFFKYTDWPLVKYVGRQENLQYDLSFILKNRFLLNHNKINDAIFSQPPVNARSQDDACPSCSEKARTRFLDSEYSALIVFGYDR